MFDNKKSPCFFLVRCRFGLMMSKCEAREEKKCSQQLSEVEHSVIHSWIRHLCLSSPVQIIVHSEMSSKSIFLGVALIYFFTCVFAYYGSQMSNFSEPQSLLEEISTQTSGELTSVEVITYVEALSRSTGKDYAVAPSAVNSTLTVTLFFCLTVATLCSSFA